MVTKKSIMEVKKQVVTNSKLEKRVLGIIIDKALEGAEYSKMEDWKIIDIFKSIQAEYSHGCGSGIIGELIYYTDTEKWFDRYKKEIIELFENSINEGLFEVGTSEDNSGFYSSVEIGGENIKVEKWNRKTTILQKKFNTYQKNILAWFSFEEIAHRQLEEIIEELETFLK